MDTPGSTWTQTLLSQWTWHWDHQLQQRLEGLTDEEYTWEPVPGAWNVRPRDPSSAEEQFGAGDFVIDWTFPNPEPAPFTTIAWRLAHVVVGVLAMRNATHFGAPRPITAPGRIPVGARRLSGSSTSNWLYGRVG